MNDQEQKESAPKLQKRAAPTADEYPIYLKNVDFGKIDPAQKNKCVYKLTSPNSYAMVSLVNGSADFRVREYRTTESEVYQQYLKGSFEYKVVDAIEFEKVALEVNAAMLQSIK